jgi:NADPH-dependent FMN reductase
MGNVCSSPNATATAESDSEAQPAAAAPAPSSSPNANIIVNMSDAKSDAPVVYVVYYSMYGHIKQLADAVAQGAKDAGADVKVFQVPETLPAEVLEKMHAPPKSDDPIATADDLTKADAIIWGLGTRFGMMNAQMKYVTLCNTKS